jgi:3-oxoadipate CoA-transferase alpha subunit
VREVDGRMMVMEKALHGDVALLEAWEADRWGNLTYNKSGRNFNPVMAMAAETVIVQAHHIVPLGQLDPENIITPGIFVDRVFPLNGAVP